MAKREMWIVEHSDLVMTEEQANREQALLDEFGEAAFASAPSLLSMATSSPSRSQVDAKISCV